jgi:hypothetical protein
MMVVVPSLTESEESHPPIVCGAITSLEAARTPNMYGEIDQPSGVVSRNGAKEDTQSRKGHPPTRKSMMPIIIVGTK